jgi:hypothetical protein
MNFLSECNNLDIVSKRSCDSTTGARLQHNLSLDLEETKSSDQKLPVPLLKTSPIAISQASKIETKRKKGRKWSTAVSTRVEHWFRSEKELSMVIVELFTSGLTQSSSSLFCFQLCQQYTNPCRPECFVICVRRRTMFLSPSLEDPSCTESDGRRLPIR